MKIDPGSYGVRMTLWRASILSKERNLTWTILALILHDRRSSYANSRPCICNLNGSECRRIYSPLACTIHRSSTRSDLAIIHNLPSPSYYNHQQLYRIRREVSSLDWYLYVCRLFLFKIRVGFSGIFTGLWGFYRCWGKKIRQIFTTLLAFHI